MQTYELITLLAADTPSRGASARLRLIRAAGLGALVALLLVLDWLHLRPDLESALTGPFFWLKAGYTAALSLAGFLAAWRLGRPGVAAGGPFRLAAAIFAVALLVALVQVWPMSEPQRLVALEGISWRVCTLNIIILALPITGLVLYVLRDLAPTRPAAAGFAAGSFAGAVAATVYGLHCPEQGPAFIALWYTLGVAISGGLGALAGAWSLRW